MIRQLPLVVPFAPAQGRADFHPAACNAVALAAVNGWRDWPRGRLMLVGPAGSGKTHLARIWATEAEAALCPATDLPGGDLPALAARTRVAVEDAAAVAGNPQAERALLHLHNLLAERPEARLLLTARTPPRDWGLHLPDLISRMQAVALVRIEAPDDTLLSSVLAKLFADRKTPVAPATIPYLVARMDRSLAAAHDLAARLDAMALAARRPVGPGMAARALHEAEAAGIAQPGGDPHDDDTGAPA